MLTPKYTLSEQMRRKKFLAALKAVLPMLQIILMIAACLFVAAILVLVFEQKDNSDFESFWDAVWWAVVTMTTVGYGDKSPTTGAGRTVAVMLMWISIVLISFFTATISSIVVARKIQEGRGLEAVKFKEHTLICGWNTDTSKVLEALNDAAQLQIVLVNETPPELMENYLDAYDNLEIRFVKGNFAREPILDRANVGDAVSAIILPDAWAANNESACSRTPSSSLNNACASNNGRNSSSTPTPLAMDSPISTSEGSSLSRNLRRDSGEESVSDMGQGLR